MQLVLFVLVVMLLPVSGAECLANPLKVDWSKVESVDPGKRIAVRVYKDKKTTKNSRIKGRFVSARSNDITLVKSDGTSLTISKDIIRSIRVRIQIPPKKRVLLALATAGAVAVINVGVLFMLGAAGGVGHEGVPVYLHLNLYTATPLALAAGFAKRREIIYKVGPLNNEVRQ